LNWRRAIGALAASLVVIGASLPAWSQTKSEVVRPTASRGGKDAVAEMCWKSRMGNAESQFQLAWFYAHADGEQRRHDWAAFLLRSAANQGHMLAQRTLQLAPWPEPRPPDCLIAVGVKRDAADTLDAITRIPVHAPPGIERMVRSLAPRYQIKPELALAIIDVESNFNPRALSPKKAMGLMQLIPETAARFGVRDAFDPEQNIKGGLAYLRWLLAYFEGNVTLVAAAYNAGEGAVDKHRGVPPFDETRDYVKRVIARVGAKALPFDRSLAERSPQLVELKKLTLTP
jgi:soluble lytic murein transglycosylase-like protein